MKLKNIGVVGAGVIGRGVAQLFAQTGHSVVLIDVSETILDEAKKAILRGLRLASMTDAVLRKADHAAIVARVHFSTNYQTLSHVDFVIENVTENFVMKEHAYQLLDRFCPAHCIFAANTSAIPIVRLASLTSRPGAFVGIHFMNPVPQKHYVELITSELTAPATLATTLEILNAANKQAIFVNDHPGFVSNRIMMLMINEAIATVEDGVATPANVDSIFVNCFAHKMGPLATADLIGLDTIMYTLDVLYDSFKNSKFEACALLRKMVASGQLGRKSGVGFFTYNK